MKGQKEYEDLRYRAIQKWNSTLFKYVDPTYIKFTYLDLAPIEFTRDNVMTWLAESGWIEGLIIRKLGEQFPYLDDYIQEIYLLIFDKIDKIIEVYETRGILAFCGYVKMIVLTNCIAKSTITYKNTRYFSKDFTVLCDDKMWNDILDTYDPDTMPFYKFNKTNQLY